MNDFRSNPFLDPRLAGSITSRTPTWRENLAGAISSLRGQDTRKGYQAAQRSINQFEALPFAGQVASGLLTGNEAYRAGAEGDYVKGGLLGLAALAPLPPGTKAAKPVQQKVIRAVEDVFSFDNPGVKRGAWDWVTSKQADAESAMAKYSPKTASGKGLVGSATAYTSKPVELDTDFLSTIKGAADEVRKPGDSQYDELLKTVEKEGWNPDPISVVVNHKGQPFIYEGNTRVAVAKAKGIKSVPAEIRWLNSGELAEGLKPEQVLQYVRNNGK